MRDIIEVQKELMPYSFDIALAGEEYNLGFMYNKTADIFTCTLSKDNEILAIEPIVYGVELFADVYISGKFPMLAIVPYDEAGIENKVTYENFNKTVFLTINDDEVVESE